MRKRGVYEGTNNCVSQEASYYEYRHPFHTFEGMHSIRLLVYRPLV